jgi:hypothetical protein
MFGIAALSIWIRMGFPVYAIANASYDDQLFIRAARYLQAGQWLGPYDSLTLAKGMFYPLFIVLAYWSSVPLKVAEQLIYLAVCALAARLIRRQASSNGLSLTAFALLSFNPVFWNVHLARVIREGIYISLSFLLVVLLVMICFPGRYAGRTRMVLRGVCLGLVGTAFWLTREEGIWLVPAIGVVLMIALLNIMLPNWGGRSAKTSLPTRSVRIKEIVVSLILAVVTFLGADYLVAYLNFRHYGIFETNEFRAKSFLRAYGALSRIQHDRWQRYIPFPKDARQRAYAVSPSARELASSFEGATGNAWLRTTCLWVRTQSCDEVGGGWEVWEFRSTVADAGHYHSGAEAMRFYDTLADEIDLACDHGAIPCLSSRATMSPPFRWEYLPETATAARPVARLTLKMNDGRIGSAASVGSAEEIAVFADMVGDVNTSSSRAESHSIRGWVAATSAQPAIGLVSHSAEEVQSSLSTMEAPDVVAVYPGLKPTRFELKTNCPVATCELDVYVPGAGHFFLPLTQLVSQAAIDIPGLRVQIDSVAAREAPDFRDPRRTLKTEIASRIASAYANAFPMLTVLGSVGLLMAILLRRFCPIPLALVALGLGSAAAVVARIGLVAYLYATSFPTPVEIIYTTPASPFVITLATIGMYAWCLLFWQSNRRLSDVGDSSAEPQVVRSKSLQSAPM